MSKIIRVAAGLITRNGQLLICQRRASDLHALKWEFPGGKVDIDEDEVTCLRRELHEELQIDATIGEIVHQATYSYPNGRTVALTFLHVPAYVGEIINTQFNALAWVEPRQLLSYDFLEGDLEFVTALAQGQWSHVFIHSYPLPQS